MHHVTSVQNDMKTMWKWVVQHGHEGLNLEAERNEMFSGREGEKQPRKSKRHTVLCQSTGPTGGGGRGPCGDVFPRVQLNQTETQRAWRSPLAPLSGKV